MKPLVRLNETVVLRMAAQKEAAWLRAVRARSTVTDGWLTMAREDWLQLSQEPNKWPWWAKLLRVLASPSDAGVGDTVERLASAVGGKQYQKLTAKLKRPCGCAARKERWNRHYRYPAPA